MKKVLFPFIALIMLTYISCKEKVDIAKEKEAIKAVFEQEKTAYFKQDYAGIGEFWVKNLHP
jgi:hypothetical protein